MRADEIDHIFEPLTQLDGSTTRRYSGLGMGLNVCKLLVELMGGKIWVDSQPGEGSYFRFTVKLGFVLEDVLNNAHSPGGVTETPAAKPVPGGEADLAESEIHLDLGTITSIVRNLTRLLGENDPQTLSVMKLLRKNISSPDLQPELKRLQNLITLYDFEEALESLSNLAGQLGISPGDED